jgi:ATP adenylyltransferase
MKNLFIPNKMGYVKGKNRPNVECILCAVINKHPDVEKLIVFSCEKHIISLNLYPYNPGHLIIFPKRHIFDLRELNDDEVIELHNLKKMCLNVLDKVYQPGGYNIGYNIGKASGASIAHLHLHIVPRYPNETGFMDILGGAKIIVEDPMYTLEKLKKMFTESTSCKEL